MNGDNTVARAHPLHMKDPKFNSPGETKKISIENPFSVNSADIEWPMVSLSHRQLHSVKHILDSGVANVLHWSLWHINFFIARFYNESVFLQMYIVHLIVHISPTCKLAPDCLAKSSWLTFSCILKTLLQRVQFYSTIEENRKTLFIPWLLMRLSSWPLCFSQSFLG